MVENAHEFVDDGVDGAGVGARLRQDGEALEAALDEHRHRVGVAVGVEGSHRLAAAQGIGHAKAKLRHEAIHPSPGGVVVRGVEIADGNSGGVAAPAGLTVAADSKVVIVHRPRYDDWSLPKGKLDPGEGWLEAALREVEEETGLQCEPHEELPAARYFDAKNRRKLVRWWLMRAIGGEFQPNDEVDELRWLPLHESMSTLSYEHDRELIRSLGAA